MLFIIPVIIDVHGHQFEIFTLVSEIHENIGLVLGIQNIFELEGIVNLRESCFRFLDRLIPFFPKKQIIFETERTMIYRNRSTINRWDLGISYGQDVR